MPRDELKKILEAIKPDRIDGEDSYGQNKNLGIGLDCCIVETNIKDIYLVQTTDFFFPLVDDPYIMGQITCANVLSDLFALGVTTCDNLLILLGVSTDMNEKEREVILPMLLKGFTHKALEINTHVRGGQTTKNPWLLLGGVASSITDKSNIIPHDSAQIGDVIILTKPLGTRLIVNAYQWYDQKMARWENLKNFITAENLIRVYLETSYQMACLNLKAAKLMHTFNARACTDVTGFGILGHAQNLVSFQHKVSFLIHTLPIIELVEEINQHSGFDFKLLEGFCSETSGGLLICVPKENAQKFCDEMKRENGDQGSWIVGEVIEGKNEATIIQNPTILSVKAIIK